LKNKGYTVGNLDCTVVLEKPKVNPHIEKMQAIIAHILEVDEDRISLKATTHEKVDSFGKVEAIKAYASALIQKV
jgi:2-C-methyl-D-erythritol 2,4-cyclodiphosphate synthase